MSHTFGALGAAMLFITLFGMAFLLAVFLIGVFITRKSTGIVPAALKGFSILVVIGGLLLSGPFTASLDDGLVLVIVFLTFFPIGGTALYLYLPTELSVFDTVAAAGLAWSISFLIGFFGIAGVDVVLDRTFGPATVEQLDVGWILSVVWVIITAFGTFQLSKYVGKWLGSPNDTRSGISG